MRRSVRLGSALVASLAVLGAGPASAQAHGTGDPPAKTLQASLQRVADRLALVPTGWWPPPSGFPIMSTYEVTVSVPGHAPLTTFRVGLGSVLTAVVSEEGWIEMVESQSLRSLGITVVNTTGQTLDVKVSRAGTVYGDTPLPPHASVLFPLGSLLRNPR